MKRIMHQSAHRLLAPFLLVAWLLQVTNATGVEAGRFQFVAGEVSIERGSGGTQSAAKGMAVTEGDTVVTGIGAAAQLKMNDTGLVALRGDTRLKIDTYRHSDREDGNERIILGLVKGSFRTLTGLIGRLRKDAYEVHTPSAVIGIRGTDHEPVFIPAEGGWSVAPGAAPGTYDKVNHGETYIATSAGRINLGPNQVGFVPPRADTPPVRLERVPEFLRATPPVTGRADTGMLRADTTAADKQRIAALTTSDSTITTPGGNTPTVALPSTAPPPPIQEPLGGTSGGIFVAPNFTAVAGGELSEGTSGRHLGAGSGLVAPNEMYVLIDSSYHPTLIVDQRSGNEPFQYARGDASVVEQGAASVDGVAVRWGIYAGGVISDGQGTRATDYFFFISAPEARLPSSLPTTIGTQTFSLVGGTRPLNELGQIGGAISAANITVDFSTATVTGYQLAVTDARGSTFSGAYTGSETLINLMRYGVPLSGNCSGGSACANNATLITSQNGGGDSRGYGLIFGPSAGGILGSYQMKASNSVGVAGAMTLRR
jgi:hypothetical protein